MELNRRTWIAALRLAAIASVLAVVVAVLATRLGEIPQAAIVLPVMVVAFVASWIQTGRIRRRERADLLVVPVRRTPSHTI